MEVKLHFFLYMELQVQVTLPLRKIVVLSEEEADQSCTNSLHVLSLQANNFGDRKLYVNLRIFSASSTRNLATKAYSEVP